MKVSSLHKRKQATENNLAIGSFLLAILWFFPFSLLSQNCTVSSNSTKPTKCLEIESLLVDACTSLEGFDEMARIRIGPNPIALNDLNNITWTSTNPWQGWASFSTTNLAKITYINNQIKAAGNCGLVIPVNPGGSLPAYCHFMLITSTVFNETAQDFSGLTDTLYVAMQNNQTISQGHFNNYGTSASRTFTIGTTSCTDVVTYDRSLLVNTSGQAGGGNGSTVNFTYSGTPSYINYGCKIPSTPLEANAGFVMPDYCQGDQVLLNGLVKGEICFVWRSATTGAGSFIDSLNQNTVFALNPSFTGKVKIYLIAFGNCSSQSKDSVEFMVNAPAANLTAQLLSNPVACNKFPIQVKATSNNPVPFHWETTGLGSFSFPDSSSSTYFPSEKDTGLIAFFVWQNVQCGKARDTLEVRLNLSPSAEFFVSDSLICSEDGNIVLTPLQKGGLFEGLYVLNDTFFNPKLEGKYTVKYKINKLGCSDSLEKTIEVKAQANAEFTLSDSLVCSGSSPIKTTPIQAGGIWYGLNGINEFNPSTSGSYPISYVINQIACKDSVTHIIKVEEKANPEFTVSDTLVCEGSEAILFTPKAIGFYWGELVENQSFIPSQAGTYKVLHVAGTGICADTAEQSIHVLPKPKANFINNPERPKILDSCKFTYTGTEVLWYKWEFGDGYSSAIQNPTHVYLLDRLVNVSLMVGNSFGCTDTISKAIDVYSDTYIFIPNVFTPNGDGVNDQFHLSTRGIRAYELRIYNRWGGLVFHSTNPDEGWDGKFGGIDCVEDAYFFLVNFTKSIGDAGSRHGSVTLLR